MKSSPTAEDLAQLAAAVAALSPLPATGWGELCAKMRVVSLPKGGTLIAAGDRRILAGIVCSGLLRSYYVSADGDELVRNFAAEGDFVSALGAALRGEASNLTVEALEPARVLVLPYRDLQAFFDRSAAWQLLGRRIVELSYLQRERHAYQLLALSGKDRYAAFRRDYPRLVGRVSQKHVAAYLGLTATSLNRLIAKSSCRSR